jgi:phospholipid transport system substrate-binding protein
MEGYTNEKVVFLNERIRKKKAQIDTKIITQTIEIPINYRMFTRANDQWRVYDLVIEGVSLIGNYRSQFRQMLEKGSFEELMDKLKKK